MVIGVNLGGAPVGDLVGLAVPGSKGLALLVQEDLQGLTAGGAVDAQSGDVAAPADCFRTEMGQVPELAALEEPLPDVLYAPLHLGLVLWMTHPGRIDDEAPVLRVLQEATGEDGMQRVSAGHRGGKLSTTRYLGLPSKKAQAASRPAITSSSFWL